MDEPNQAEQVREEADQTSPVESEQSEQAAQSQVDEVEEAAATAPEAEVEEVREKPTRSDRRVQQLLGKLKGISQAEKQGDVPQSGAERPKSDRLPWEDEPQGLKFEPGREYTPDELDAELNRRAAEIARKEVHTVLSQNRIQQSANEYASELESLQREAPELKDGLVDERFSELLVNLNSDANGNFVPRYSPKQIYDKYIRPVASSAATKASAETKVKLVESRESSAVTPGSGKTHSTSYEAENLFHEASRTGSTEDWSRYLKKTMFGK